MTQLSLGLVRVTVATPQRRVDVALPESAPVAELLPHLVRHAADGLAAANEHDGGWELRRTTGAALQPTRGLGVQQVRDGEVLHLVARRTTWPEPAYDDVVEVIAGGARRTGTSWGGATTRRFGFAVATVVLALGVVEVIAAGPPWRLPIVAALGVAALLVLGGVVAARAAGDANAGAVVAGAALPYAGLAGALYVATPTATLSQLGAPSALAAGATVLAFSVVAYVGVAGARWLFMASGFAGGTAAIGALLCLSGVPLAGGAAITLTIAIALLPAYPLIASWLGRIPIPALPDRPEEILADRPKPARAGVFAAVARASELLTGMLLGSAIIAVGSIAVLARDGGTAGRLLCLAAVAALLLRARLFPTPLQRTPLLVGGILGGALLATLATPAGPELRLVRLLLLAGAAALVLAAAMVYSRRKPSPYLGRMADIVDVVAIVVLIPLTFSVTGVFDAIRSLFASFGG